MTKEMARRVLEMSYLYCWGNEGTSDLRDEWRSIYAAFQKLYNVGRLLNRGLSGISWHDK